MLIVFEGCDGSGKTTFMQRVASKLAKENVSVVTLKRSVPQHPVLEEYELDLEKQHKRWLMDSHAVLCDRWHLGETIYGPLYRGMSQLSPGDVWHVDAFLQARGAVQVVMTQPLDVIRERLAHRGETFLRQEDVERVCRAYEDHVSSFHRSTSRFVGDPTEHDVSTLIDDARAAAQRTLPLALFTTYVGPPDPEIVLLGERRKRPSRFPDHQAAFVPYPGTSGRWLCDAIAQSPQLSEYRVGLANACEENVTELVRTLGTPRVVALGRDAAHACEETWCEHGEVPHPQYGRRFKHRKQREYAAAIYEAAMTHERVKPKW